MLRLRRVSLAARATQSLRSPSKSQPPEEAVDDSMFFVPARLAVGDVSTTEPGWTPWSVLGIAAVTSALVVDGAAATRTGTHVSTMDRKAVQNESRSAMVL